jgi:PPOX class probable F420-dependent enzyme
MSLTPLARELIRGPNYCTVATIGQQGLPHLSSVWVDRDDDTILMCTFDEAVKLKHLRRDPRGSLIVVNSANPYQFVTVEFRVAGESGEGGPALIDRLSVKYAGCPYRGHELARKWVVLQLSALKVSEYGSALYP